MKVTKFEELNFKQIEKLDRDKTILFQPISPTEEHGPHLPVGTDLLTAVDTATEAIKTLNEKKPGYNHVLLPAIPVGYCKSTIDFPGSVHIGWKAIRDIVYGLGSSLARHGFKYLIICTYHMAYGHLRGIYAGMKKTTNRYNIKIVEPWSPVFYSGEIEKNEPKLGFDTSKELHADFKETSLMKYQYPYLVDESYKKLQNIYRDMNSPRVIGKTFKQLGLKEGYIGSPSKADADYGRWFFNQTVNVYVQAAHDLIAGKKPRELPNNVKLIMRSLHLL